MKKLLLAIAKILAALYIVVCLLLYFFQEKLIFIPQKLDKNYAFEFEERFEEIITQTEDGKYINGVLFKADSSKGLIFYLHGNAGSVSSWGQLAKTYTQLNYDVFMLDYRGYGKSEGEIYEQDQVFKDNQVVYNALKKYYKEEQIIVLGYSIGTGPAAKLASTNNPKMLILQAPYYNLTDLMQQKLSLLPTFILKYKFATNDYLKFCKMPVVIFHGTADEVIYYGSSLKLKEEFKKQDTLIPLMGRGHNGITENEVYRTELRKLLSR